MARKSKDVARESHVSPDDEASCFHEYSEKKAEIGRIQKSIKASFERYKALGVDTAAIKYAYSESLKDDPEARAKARTSMLVRLGIISFEDSGQGSFLGGLAVENKPSDEMARKIQLGRVKSDGYNTGYKGGTGDANPWEPGSEPYVAWRAAFFSGCEDRLAHRPDLADVTTAAPRKRRGRPSNAELAARAAAAASSSNQAGGTLLQ